MNGVGGHEGCRLGAQTVVAHGNRREPGIEACFDFRGRKVAFWADEQSDIGAGGVCFCQQPARGVGIAVTHEFLIRRYGALAEELLQRHGVVDARQYGLERLFHGRHGNLFYTVVFEFFAFGALAAQRYKAVDAYLDELFDKPLHAVGVLCGCHGHSDVGLPHLRQRYTLYNLYCGPAVVVVEQAATVKGAAAVDGFNFVARTVTEHTHGMAAFPFGKQSCRIDVGSVEAYHIRLRCRGCLRRFLSLLRKSCVSRARGK